MGGTWRVAILGLAVAGLAIAYLGVDVAQRTGADAEAFATDMAAAGLGVIALWFVFARLSRHFRDMERLRDDLAALRHLPGPPGSWDGGRMDELGRLADAVAEAFRRERRAGGRAGDRLAAVAMALEEPVLTLDENGRIATLNAAAARLLGNNAAPGMDVYDHIDRPALFRAIEQARAAGELAAATLARRDGSEFPARVADLGLGAGVAVVFPVRPPEYRPARAAVPAGRAHGADHEPLGTLPMTALWVATSEPQTGGGRVVGVGTVRLSGGRVFRTVSFDLLVDTGEPLPAAAAAAHGIAPLALAGARPFAEVWPVVAEALRGSLVVGVGVEAALAALGREVERAGIGPFEAPPALDLGRLAAALDPALDLAAAEPDLPALAAAVGVEHHEGPNGTPHALLAAELASVLVHRLDARGIATLGETRALMAA
ncbi:exonuclease domain-containing protein [Azospirillum sp. ST 5-10]|uniref:exonuclease domain-containing protein n=1 Tax=unclassified Azospirillum TaxID=2630922 RepID=UPI003F49E1F2